MKELIFEGKVGGVFSLMNYINENITQISDFTYPVKIKNSDFESITGMELNVSSLEIVNVEFNGIENEFSINLFCCIIHNKLLIRNCDIRTSTNFYALHCLGEIIIENCTFHEFVDFGDCWFKNNVIIKSNTFKKGANLLGNKGKPYEVTFDKKPIIEGNQGVLDMDVLP